TRCAAIPCGAISSCRFSTISKKRAIRATTLTSSCARISTSITSDGTPERQLGPDLPQRALPGRRHRVGLLVQVRQQRLSRPGGGLSAPGGRSRTRETGRFDYRITDEVWLEPTPGHTPGRHSVRISSKGHDAVITGDLIHHPVQFQY